MIKLFFQSNRENNSAIHHSNPLEFQIASRKPILVSMQHTLKSSISESKAWKKELLSQSVCFRSAIHGYYNHYLHNQTLRQDKMRMIELLFQSQHGNNSAIHSGPVEIASRKPILVSMQHTLKSSISESKAWKKELLSQSFCFRSAIHGYYNHYLHNQTLRQDKMRMIELLFQSQRGNNSAIHRRLDSGLRGVW